jgi:hypothetical protein
MMKSKNDEMLIAKILVKLLNSSRSVGWEEWNKVGFCLYNISPELFDVWDEFSQQCSTKYKYSVCRRYWDNYSKYTSGKKMTIGSLYYWAMQDNPNEYLRLKGLNVI